MLKLSSGKSDVDWITFYDSKYSATAIRKYDGIKFQNGFYM